MFPYGKLPFALPENIRKFVEDGGNSTDPKTVTPNPAHYEQIIQHQLIHPDSAAFKNHVSQVIDDFHAHLDICYQCRNHPMNLCPTGALLIQRVASPPNSK